MMGERRGDFYQALSARWRPEDVAEAILVAAPRLPARLRQLLQRAARGHRASSMSAQFASAVQSIRRQVETALHLFPAIGGPTSCDDPEAVREYVTRLRAALRFRDTDSDFAGRWNRESRVMRGLPKGHRAYNKRLRLVLRLEKKCTQWRASASMRDLAQVAKTRLASRIAREDFEADTRTGYFCAYMTARLGLRSQFTWGAQVRAYDEVAAALLAWCVRHPETTRWHAIAHVHPAPEVLRRLSDGEKGRLLGLWFDVMERAAGALAQLAASDGYDLERLVVQRGNDSSTWNEAAGAFNKARDGWIGLLYALGATDVLEQFCPGKALRLMAADVVALHRVAGSGGLEPDTQVWRLLPYPWEVMAGRRRCTRADVERACATAGVTTGKGWVAPRPRHVAKFTPTPELVHGVTVASPQLAKVLRSCGYFSGPSKGVRHIGPPIMRQVREKKVVVRARGTAQDGVRARRCRGGETQTQA